MGTGSVAEPSLLGPRPLGLTGDAERPAENPAIEPPFTTEDGLAAVRLAAQQEGRQIHIPRAAELTYQTSGALGDHRVEQRSVLRWRQDGQYYDARWTLYNPKIHDRTQHVTGLLTPQGLIPMQAEVHTPQKFQIHFDYASETIRFDTADHEERITAGTQDRLSALFQLAALIAGEPERYPAGTTLEFPAAHAHGPGVWHFTVESEEELTALGNQIVPTIRLAHQAQNPDDAQIEVWLGRTLDYLPVRVRVTEANQDVLEHNLTTAYARPTPSKPASSSGVSESTLDTP